MTSKLSRLRAEYLWPLAHLCHLGAAEVDALDVWDFARYIDSTDAYIEALNRERR